MNKILLSFCAAAMSIVAYAGTTPGLEYQWGKIIDGKTISIISKNAISLQTP